MLYSDGMEVGIMETTLSKVGNSMAVLLPKALRAQACFEPEERLRLESPRKGVVVITALHADDEDRLSCFEAVQTNIKKRRSRVRPWPTNASADELLQEGKDRRTHEIASL